MCVPGEGEQRDDSQALCGKARRCGEPQRLHLLPHERRRRLEAVVQKGTVQTIRTKAERIRNEFETNPERIALMRILHIVLIVTIVLMWVLRNILRRRRNFLGQALLVVYEVCNIYIYVLS